jgi:hypothetical protein
MLTLLVVVDVQLWSSIRENTALRMCGASRLASQWRGAEVVAVAAKAV